MNEIQQQRAAIEEFLTLVHPHQSLIELRAFGTVTFSGHFTDTKALARNAAALDAQGLATSTYFTLNPVSTTAIKNPKNVNKVLRSPHHATKDKDIARRGLYLIDVDPVRPSGISSTWEEKAEALVVLTQIRQYIAALGWPEPIVIDSGNGYHLLYKGDGCNANSRAWVHVLKYLDRTFSTESAKVDTSVGNPARISRLPGTWNRKGENTPERPHRLSRVISYPAKFELLMHGHISRLATANGYESEYDRAAKFGGDKPELLINENGVHQLIKEFPELLQLGYESRRDDGMYFFLSECPFKGGAHRDQMGKTAIILRPDHIGFSCFSDDCHEHTFGALIKLLTKTTGRRPSMPIWNTTTWIEDWRYEAFGIDPPWVLELNEEYRAGQEQILKESPEWQYDNATHSFLQSEDFRDCPLSTDPEEWGVSHRLVFDHFVQNALEELRSLEGESKAARYEELQTICITDDATMGAYLGKERLFVIARDQNRPSDGSTVKDTVVTEEQFMFILGATPGKKLTPPRDCFPFLKPDAEYHRRNTELTQIYEMD